MCSNLGSSFRGPRVAGGALAALLLVAGACSDARDVTGPAVAGGAGPSAAITTVGYTTVVGDDWKSYASKTDLRAADYFWWFRTEDVYNWVDLVPDATFGQVARITFQQSDETGFAPRLSKEFAPMDRMWYRYRMKFSPGWTTVGPLPTGWANAYKVAFWLWEGYEGRGQVELSNTDEYVLGFRVSTSSGQSMGYTERQLAGSQSWGHITTEWTDSEWWEYVILYEKTGATSARNHWWKRRLTSGGAIANNAWTYIGIEVTGATTPQVRGVELGANKNKSNPQTEYIYWGPWEVVDGTQYPNPWNMPNVSGGTTTPPPPPAATLTRVDVTPDTATVAAGATRQFAATGFYSDGTSKALAVTWSASGGTVSSSGLYTAPSSPGIYVVRGRDAATGLADSARVTVPAVQQAATLQQVIVSPATASVQMGGTVQFVAQGRYSDGTTKAVAVTWSATGGTISSAGLYTAGSTAGSFQVIATAQGSSLAGSADVTVRRRGRRTGG